MITVRRRRNRAGGWVYQIWPDDLPASQPVPPWLPGTDHAPASRATIAVAVAKEEFRPLPYDAETEEAELSQGDFDDFFSSPADEDESSDRDYPGWGSY